MKKKRLIKITVLLFIILLVYLIFQMFRTDKIRYVALGDSLAAGMNPYGEVGYGYSDYLKDELKSRGKLSYYTKVYASSGYTASSLTTSIKENSLLKKDLRESNLVTVSIGASDLLNKIDRSNFSIEEITSLKRLVTNIFPDIETAIKEIRKYAKEKVVIVGYYNPIPFLFNTNGTDLDELFAYIDEEYQKIATKYDCKYVSIYKLFKSNSSLLPNPSDIHPSLKGYEKIAKKLLKVL